MGFHLRDMLHPPLSTADVGSPQLGQTLRWSRTLAMNQALCAAVGGGSFPSPAMLVHAGVQRLQSQCGLGYRAKTLLKLAVQVPLFLADLG